MSVTITYPKLKLAAQLREEIGRASCRERVYLAV